MLLMNKYEVPMQWKLKFFIKIVYVSHILAHERNKPFPCKYCNENFDGKAL